jgi:hypothetical protein
MRLKYSLVSFRNWLANATSSSSVILMPLGRKVSLSISSRREISIGDSRSSRVINVNTTLHALAVGKVPMRTITRHEVPKRQLVVIVNRRQLSQRQHTMRDAARTCRHPAHWNPVTVSIRSILQNVGVFFYEHRVLYDAMRKG